MNKKITQEDVDKAWEKAREAREKAWKAAWEAREDWEVWEKAWEAWNKAWGLEEKFKEQNNEVGNEN